MKKKISFYLAGSFLIFQLFFVVCLFLIYIFGYEQAAYFWLKQQEAEIINFAKKYLVSAKQLNLQPPSNFPFIILNPDKEILFSNRSGNIFHLLERYDKLITLQEGGSVLGYLKLGKASFASDAASQTLSNTLLLVLFLSLVVSLGGSLFSLIFFSRLLNRPLNFINKQLAKIGQGNFNILPLEFKSPTEFVFIGEQINSLALQLENQRKSWKRLSADLIHDLKTPLSALKVQLEGMIDGVLSVDQTRLKRLKNELSRLESLASALQELAIFESPDLKINKSKIDLTTFFNELIERFAGKLKLKKISCSKYIQNLSVIADQNLLERAFSNLLDNAIRYTTKGGSIKLEANKDKDKIKIIITNTGKPIPKAEIPFIFERLYRGEKSRHSPGSGLGLTIAKQIIELHGGQIMIQSNKANGTSVLISINQ